MNYSSLLPTRGLLFVSGEDAPAFLQGLITNNIQDATGDHAIFAALLSPQGKFLHDFFILREGNGFWFDLEREQIPALIKRFTLYRLRSKVSFEDRSELYSIVAAWGAPNPEWPEGALAFRDPRHGLLGWRAIVKKGEGASHEAAYDLHRLALGIPDGAKDLTPDRSLLLEWGYDKLNAIDFTKGCYVGQEVTARSKHRASLRKYMHQVATEAEALPAAGTPILGGEKEIGTMASSQGRIGLAMIRVEELEQAGEDLTSGGIRIQAQLPEWMKD